METHPLKSTLVDVAATLVFMQGAIGVMSVIESGVATAAGFAPPTNLLLTAALTVMLFSLARGLRRRSKRARTSTVILEVMLVVWATVDLVLAVALAHSGLGLVPVVTRFVVPIVVFRLVRRPTARMEFALRNPDFELQAVPA